MKNYLQIIIPPFNDDDVEIAKTLSEYVKEEDYKETIYELKQKAIEEDFLHIFKWTKSVIHTKKWEYSNFPNVRFETWKSNCIEDLDKAIRRQSMNVTEELIQTIHQSTVIPDNIGQIRESLSRTLKPGVWWRGRISREFIEMLLRQNLIERSFFVDIVKEMHKQFGDDLKEEEIDKERECGLLRFLLDNVSID